MRLEEAESRGRQDATFRPTQAKPVWGLFLHQIPSCPHLGPMPGVDWAPVIPGNGCPEQPCWC